MNTLERLRAKRAERLARREAEVNNQGKEYLNVSALPKGVSIWFPQGDKPSEHVMRIVQFEVTDEKNMAGDSVGDFASRRTFKVHYNIGNGGQTIICPRSFNKPCPVCEMYEAYPKEERLRRDSPASKLKPKVVSIFNALFREATEDGKTVLKLRVVRGGDYALTSKLNSTIKEEVELHKKDAEKIYLYDDLEMGYWITARFSKATMTGKGGGDPFMQITRVDLDYKGEPKAVSEKILEKIVDLDALIPKSMSYEEIAKLIGTKPTVAEEPEDGEFADEVEAPKKANAKAEEALEEDEVEEAEEAPKKSAKPLKDSFTKPEKVKAKAKVEEEVEEETEEEVEETEETEEAEEVEEAEEEQEEVEAIEEAPKKTAPVKKATPTPTKSAPAKPAAPVKKTTAPAKKADPAPASDDDEFGADFDAD